MEKKEVQQTRVMLSTLQNDVLKRIASLPANSPEQRQGFEDLIALNKYSHQLEDSMMQKYGVTVLEKLEKEARILRYLNIILIGLTGILAVLTAVLAFHL